jgi:hypothetical protein
LNLKKTSDQQLQVPIHQIESIRLSKDGRYSLIFFKEYIDKRESELGASFKVYDIEKAEVITTIKVGEIMQEMNQGEHNK